MDPELEVVETPEAPPPPLNERPADGPGSGRGELRKQLEKSAEQERKGREARTPKETKEPAPKRQARGLNHQETEEPEVEETPETLTEGIPDPEVKDQAPEGFSKEAKAEWQQTPNNVRAAILKRVEDMNKGVNDLKQKYSELDQVLSPRLELFRRHGHTPAAAVNQMFLWFDALANNPDQAFPALAQSFKYDMKRVLNGAAPAVAPKEQEQPQSEPWKTEIEGFRGQVNQTLQGLMQQFQQSQMAKTEEVLSTWAKDKPYFEDVRQTMAHFVQSGLALGANGQVDLDKAYDMAVYALPDTRAKIGAQQEAEKAKAAADKARKEKDAQQAQADKARRAAGGAVRTSAPGEVVPANQRKGKGKSVSESLREAIAEARDQ